MYLHPRRRRAPFYASLALPLTLAGCAVTDTVTSSLNPTPMAEGNWQISSSSTAAAHLSILSGEFATTSAGTVTGTLHTQSANACVDPQISFNLTGSEDAEGNVTLTGPLAGGALTLKGVLAADGRSLKNATYSVTGGNCAFVTPVPALAQNFAPVTGNYIGSFADVDGQIAQVTADFSQSTTPDANGNFTLAGSAAIAGNPCFPATVPISNTQVTGGTFTFTYAANGSSVTANGTFSADAATLSITGWTASGSCGPDTGVPSTMTKH